MTDFPALEQFLGGHFHQDWRLDYRDEWDALSDFVTGERDLVPSLAKELNDLLSKGLPEASLSASWKSMAPTSSPAERMGAHGVGYWK